LIIEITAAAFTLLESFCVSEKTALFTREMLEAVVKTLFLLHVVTDCNCYRINFIRTDGISRSSALMSRSSLFCSPLGLNDDQKVIATLALDVDMSSDESILDTENTDLEETILNLPNGDENERLGVEDEEDVKGAGCVEEVEEVEEIDLNPGAPKCYVIISNLQSGSNIGSICRNALAFNVHEVIVIGRKGFRDKMRNADRGAKRKQAFVHFNSILEAATYLKETKNCSIVGVEIMDSAVSVLQFCLE
jgi:SpoU rRNA Methylase family